MPGISEVRYVERLTGRIVEINFCLNCEIEVQFLDLNLKQIPFKQCVLEYVFHYSTKKRKHSFSILKAFFVRHSSEYETSDNDQKVNRNIYTKTKKAFSMLKECFRFFVL